MKLFGRKKTENWIIKLFKITDRKTAENFGIEKCILSTIDLIRKYSDLKATDFDINYRDSRKSFNGYKKALKNQKEIVYSFVGFDSDRSNTYFSISNPMLNWTEQPKNSTIDICIQINSAFAVKRSAELIAEELIENYDYEYGYVTELPSNFDATTEKKKGLFSTSAKVNEIDHAWTFHSVGILEGFIKSIYPINYLNKSHFIDLATKELISKYGITEKITENIYKWTLNSEEFEKLRNNEHVEKISIITSVLGFLKTEKAKLFENKMKNTYKS